MFWQFDRKIQNGGKLRKAFMAAVASYECLSIALMLRNKQLEKMKGMDESGALEQRNMLEIVKQG